MTKIITDLINTIDALYEEVSLLENNELPTTVFHEDNVEVVGIVQDDNKNTINEDKPSTFKELELDKVPSTNNHEDSVFMHNNSSEKIDLSVIKEANLTNAFHTNFFFQSNENQLDFSEQQYSGTEECSTSNGFNFRPIPNLLNPFGHHNLQFPTFEECSLLTNAHLLNKASHKRKLNETSITPIKNNTLNEKPLIPTDKKLKTSEPNIKVNKPQKVIIYNSKTFNGTLTSQEELMLKQKLIDGILYFPNSSSQLAPRFEGAGLNSKNLFEITCADSDSLAWLIKNVDRLTVGDTKFNIYLECQIPPILNKFTMILPDFITIKSTRVLELLRKQNPTLKTFKWKVFHSKKHTKHIEYLVGIDDNSVKALELMNYSPYFGLEKIIITAFTKLKHNK